MLATSNSRPSKKVYHILGIVLGAVVFALSLFYLCIAVRNNWLSLSARLHQIRIPFCVAALAVLLIAYLYEPRIWQNILSRLGFRIPAAKATGIFYLSSLALYLPVKAVDLVGRIMLLKRTGCPIEIGGASVFYEAWLSLAASMMFALYFPVARIVARIPEAAPYWAVLWAAAAVCVAVLAVATVKTGLGAARLVFKTSPSMPYALPAAFTGVMLVYFVVLRIVSGLAFFLCLGSIIQFNSINFYEAVSVQSLSWVASLVAFFVPKGLAVREALIVSVLAPSYGAGAAITAALMYRLLTIVLDLALGLFGLIITGRTELGMAEQKEQDGS
jgi:uncharacterized membrane protein YbhN (UPF0104 family)